jgi:hypothetical protein
MKSALSLKSKKPKVGRPVGSTKPEAEKKKKISVSFGKALWLEASKFALEHDISLSGLLEEAVERYMDDVRATERGAS